MTCTRFDIQNYKMLICNVFSTPEMIRFLKRALYKTDPVFRSNEIFGRYLKQNATYLGIKEIQKGASVTVDDVKTRASVWEII